MTKSKLIKKWKYRRYIQKYYILKEPMRPSDILHKGNEGGARVKISEYDKH